jgi:hypothetical protein
LELENQKREIPQKFEWIAVNLPNVESAENVEMNEK